MAAVNESGRPTREVTRERLLDAAFEVFSDVGVAAASVEAIAAAAEFTRGAFYSNFSSKDELFLALLEREFQRRTSLISTRAFEIGTEGLERAVLLDPQELAELVTSFLQPSEDATAWFILETEFLLAALRDATLAPKYHTFMTRSAEGFAEQVQRLLEVAGRAFTIPTPDAIGLLTNEYASAVRVTALAGADAAGGLSAIGERLVRIIFAITRPAGHDNGV